MGLESSPWQRPPFHPELQTTINPTAGFPTGTPLHSTNFIFTLTAAAGGEVQLALSSTTTRPMKRNWAGQRQRGQAGKPGSQRGSSISKKTAFIGEQLLYLQPAHHPSQGAAANQPARRFCRTDQAEKSGVPAPGQETWEAQGGFKVTARERVSVFDVVFRELVCCPSPGPARRNFPVIRMEITRGEPHPAQTRFRTVFRMCDEEFLQGQSW